MSIDKTKLYKFYKDTGIMDSLDDTLSDNYYFISFNSSNTLYSAYLDGAGMDYSRKYGAKARETICYNGNDIFYQNIEDVFGSEEGYDPEIVTKDDLIRRKEIRFDNEILINEPEIREKLDSLITINFGITEELIDCFNKGKKEDVERIKNQISEIIRHDNEIRDNKAKISSFDKSIRYMKNTVKKIENDKRNISHNLLYNPNGITIEKKELK